MPGSRQAHGPESGDMAASMDAYSAYQLQLPYHGSNNAAAGPSTARNRQPTVRDWSPGPRADSDDDRFVDAEDGEPPVSDVGNTRPLELHHPQDPWTRSYAPLPPAINGSSVPAQTAHRDRLVSSSSLTSMSSTPRGKRAPAPAALDLSPRSEREIRERQQMSLGLGNAPTIHEPQKRAVTDTSIQATAGHRASRPLPHIPTQPPLRSVSNTLSPRAAYSMYNDERRDGGQADSEFSSPAVSVPSLPQSPAVPLSAFGPRVTGQRPSIGRRSSSIAPEEEHRPSIDSYYLRSPLTAQKAPDSLADPPSPASPEFIDPNNIDRGSLIGVGELSTPRWAASTGLAHLRTPSVPQIPLTTPPMPQQNAFQSQAMPVSSTFQTSWMQSESGFGLGVGVMERVVEESPAKEGSRPRSSLPPPPAPLISPHGRPSQAPSYQKNTLHESPPLISLGSLSSFNFDTSIEAALADSLSIAKGSPPGPSHSRLSSLPPSVSESTSLSSHGSPGSARSRIYARRLERQAAAEAAVATPKATAPQVPMRSTSKVSPPNSADSQSSLRVARDSRKTPPAKDRDPHGAKTRQSPSHDIIKHFAPKDFSHLPPSPSSASINHFLRGSGSVSNFPNAGPPSTIALSPSTSSFSQLPQPKAALQRSDSHRSKLGKGGWEGRDVDASTAEALRKLDGLGNTPSKRAVKAKSSSGPYNPSSRPGSPPGSKGKSSERRLTNKSSLSSFHDADHGKDSPLNNWVDVANEVPSQIRARTTEGSQAGLDMPRTDKRESSSSTSFVGTPTSRESMPTTATTPNSIIAGGKAEKSRRASGGSDMSAYSDAVDTMEKPGQAAVPPVPPLPKGFVSMRQISAAAPAQPVVIPEVHEAAPSHSPALPSRAPEPRRTLDKKWSFSSALNMKMGSRDVSPPDTSDEPISSPQTPWSEIEHNEVASPTAVPTPSASSDMRSTYSTTPVAPAAPGAKAGPSVIRITPSSIPFFRRTSSSSVQKLSAPTPETPKTSVPPANNRTVSGTSTSSTRKSVLGMHLPSMLRGSASKRGLSQAVNQPTGPTLTSEAPKTAPVEAIESKQENKSGWNGRKRGKTLSISGDPPFIPAPARQALKPKTSVEGSLSNRGSISSNRSGSTVNGTNVIRSDLPSILGSPSVRHVSSSSSLSRNGNDSSIPATRIPRIASRPTASPAAQLSSTNGPGGSMPPPSTITHSRSITLQSGSNKPMTATVSMADMGSGRVGEFGTLNGTSSNIRASASTAHRAHLLAPMSSRPEARRPAPRPVEIRPEGVPPSKRHMPVLPSSATAMTLSSQAKRTSREFRPSVSRRSSKDTSSATEDEPTMKPSKSLHSKLGVPRAARIASSSSVGAPGTNTSFRASTLLSSSQSPSPFEDDETLADAEMHAYVERRKARKAAGKKEDLSDINAFPEDIEAGEPMSQRSYISKHLASMSDIQRKEILDFDTIYYSPPTRTIRPARPGSAIFNNGYDDERGDYLVVQGDHLCYRYEVIGVLGKGSFGQVLQCRDHKTGSSVAIKIIRNKKRFHTQALVEVKILQDLVQWDPEDKHNMVRMTDHFYFRSHLCIVTELLSINLFELIKANQFAGFSTVLIRRFTTQMLSSLQLMRSHRVVHCDLKPENILLRHPRKSGIKVIDFGSSCLETERVYTYIQSRFYRSPEVILGMNYAMAIDMWSLGCILAELYTGVPIFPGENEHEQLACIMEVLGVPDRHMVDKASRRKVFFDAMGMPRPFVNEKGKRRRPGTKTLASVLRCDDELFVDFIARCLTWDPDKRLKPQPAMRHPWILAGRRRQQATSRDEKRLSDRSALSSLAPTRTNTRNNDSGSMAIAKDKKSLIISPPTPLMARQPSAHVTASASKVGSTLSSTRLHAHGVLRNSTYVSTSKMSMG